MADGVADPINKEYLLQNCRLLSDDVNPNYRSIDLLSFWEISIQYAVEDDLLRNRG